MIRRILWILASRILVALLWTAAGVSRLVDWMTERCPVAETTPEKPFPGPIVKDRAVEDRKQWDPDLHMRRLAWAERQEWEERVYEDIEEMTQPGEAEYGN